MTAFAFYGTFTGGQPGHGNLAGATLVEQTRTASRYRLYDVDDLPALVQVSAHGGWGAYVASRRGPSPSR